MEKLRNLLFYGGATPDVYRNCRDEIRKENLRGQVLFVPGLPQQAVANDRVALDAAEFFLQQAAAV